MVFRIGASLVLVIGLLAATAASKDEPPGAGQANLDRHVETLVSGKKKKDRIESGLELGRADPDRLALALDKVIEAKREGDCELVAQIAVETHTRHVRLLLVWAASKLGEAGPIFLDRIDNDYPMESMRAFEALGFLKENSAVDRLLPVLRSQDQFMAIQAARALARLGTKKQAKPLVEALLVSGTRHVRTHIAWAIQDLVGGRSGAAGMIGKYKGKKGAHGDRAREALNTLSDEMAGAERYKVKLKEVRKFFNRRGGLKPPPIIGGADYAENFRKALDLMKEKTPAYHHLVCTAIGKITLTGSEKRFQKAGNVVNFRPAEAAKWKDRDGKPFLNLYNYYLVRYAVILFLAQMGDPTEGHRGVEEGIVEAWQYAMDHTDVALAEDLEEFMKGILRKPPW